MKQLFKEAYERELLLLKERASQFARDYPGLADRLGGLQEENLDPSIAGLLEGTAFMAARVQVNINQHFRTFSSELLEQICPDMSAPLPSAMLVQGEPPNKPADLLQGRTIPTGSYIEAVFSEDTRRIPCRFCLTEPITFWPLAISQADYHGKPTSLNALGCDGPDMTSGTAPTAAGLVISLKRTDGAPLDGLPVTKLPFHFTGTMQEANALYAQIFANTVRVSLRWEDDLGTPTFRRLPPDAVEQVGFDHNHPLFGRDDRQFPGISALLEYFSFPRKIMGFCIRDMSAHLSGIPSNEVQIVFEFDAPDSHLTSHFDAKSVRLFCAPAVNLFEDDAKPVTLDNRQHRVIVAPNRAPATHYEVHRITKVQAQYEGTREKVDVLPLYGIPTSDSDQNEALYYTMTREPRSLSQQERRAGGTRFRYEGTETWLTYYEPPEQDPAHLLFVRTLCSNRHLPEILPISETRFYLLDDRMVVLHPCAGPSAPREAVAELEVNAPHRMTAGDNYWRLISLLSLSYRGLVGVDGKGNVEAIREVLRLFSDVSDQLTEAQISSLKDVIAKPRTRTIKRADGYHPARGLEVTLTFDDDRMDRNAIIALGSVLDRFLADYAAINTFTQCVIATTKGKVLKTWPPRSGSGPLL